MISSPPFDGTSNELCDWMELAVLASPLGRIPLADINLELEIEGEDFESEDMVAEDEVREKRILQVVNAFEERKQAMKNAYPFVRSETHLSLVEDISDGGTAYLFCLVLANAAPGGLLHSLGEGAWTPDLKSARNLFQACATVCAGGHTGGPAFSVGWPRDDHSAFLTKLKQVYQAFGDGKPHDEKPGWAPPAAKDHEIDVIAWRLEPDGRTASTYLLAQAASGANWKGKSLKAAIETFHSTWFKQPPASHASPGLIMPFFVSSPGEADASDHEDQDRIANEWWRTAKEMGVLLYRNRVAYYVDAGVALAAGGTATIEGLDALPKIRAWVDGYRNQLKQADEAMQ